MSDLKALESKTARAINSVRAEIAQHCKEAEGKENRLDDLMKEIRESMRGVEAKVELIPVFMKDVNDLKVESRDTREVTIKTQVLVSQIVAQMEKFPLEKMAGDVDHAHKKIRVLESTTNEHQLRMAQVENRPAVAAKEGLDKIKYAVFASVGTAIGAALLKSFGII